MENRRHDLSDAIAILGTTSVPRAVKEYSKETIQLRNEDKDAYYEIDENTLNIIGNELNVHTKGAINVSCTGDLTISAAAGTTITSEGDITVKAPNIKLN